MNQPQNQPMNRIRWRILLKESSNLGRKYTRMVEYINRCDGTELVQDSIVSTPGSDTIPFELVGNNLTLDIMAVERGADGSTIVLLREHFTRQGSGTGLQGTWMIDSSSYQVLQGSPDELTRDSLEYEQTHRIAYDKANLWRLVIDATTFMEFDAATPKSLADQFINDWNGVEWYYPDGSDSTRYDITVSKLSDTKVRLSGIKTQEVVTITLSDDKEMYSSSVANHAAQTYYYEPISCPNAQPSWYYEFLAANQSLDFQDDETINSLTKKTYAPKHHQVKSVLKRLGGATGYSRQ
jgi:hypothetical protein